MEPDAGITEAQFPALYGAADQNSVQAQRRILAATKTRLSLLVGAAFFGAFTWHVGSPDVAGMIAALAFAGALAAELYLLRARPERVWYQGRAAAESAKTLTWRYLVGGAPFGKTSHDERGAEELLLKRLHQIAAELPGLALVPMAGRGEQITAAMRAARALPLANRRELYRRSRIRDQREWYTTKAQWNERRAALWSLGLTVAESVGLVGAILKASDLVELDLLGVAAAIVGSGAAWVQAKQHQTLAAAYAVASQELADIDSRIEWDRNEEQWSEFVDQAEEAISREHTLWRASHSA